MANSYQKGVVYIDTASAQAVAATNRLKIKYALIIPAASGDTVEISETSTSTNPSLVLKAPTNGQHLLDFSREPIVMDGVYVNTVSSNAVVLLYTTSRGGQ